MVRSLLLSMLAVLSAPVISAETRCQCDWNNWHGNCVAEAHIQGDWIKFKSSTQHCSRITWYAGPDPQTTIVTDGVETEQWLGSTELKKVSIESCKVCTDAMYPDGYTETPTSDNQQTSVNSSSPFHGTWTDKGGSFLNSYTETVVINVEGNKISGTYGGAKISGSIDGKVATFQIFGMGTSTMTMTLISDTEATSSWGFGSGKMTKN